MRPDVIQELEPELESVEGDRHRSWVWEVIRHSTQAKIGLGILLFFIVLHAAKGIGWLHGRIAELLLVRL